MTRPVSPTLQVTSGAMLVALAMVWGGSFFFAEIALRELPPLTITLHRVFWAVPVLLAAVLGNGIEIPRSARVWLAYLVMGALNNAIPFSLIFWGQTHIESGLASILNATTAVFGAVVAGLLLADEPLTARKIAGAGLGVLGVAVIMGRDALMTLDPRSLSQLAVIGAALSYSLASVWAKRMLSGQPPIMNALGMLVGSTVLMLPVVVAVDGPPALALQTTTLGALVALSVMSTALAYLLYFAILARAGAANLLLVTLLIPPFAIGLGAAFLGERLGAEVWPGALCIALGLAVTDGRPLRWLTAMGGRAPQ
ncbi:DMT family transporter [Defluviimonas salinarum]|uniref:DMT family transporter n=1 Tax=Defluviimonas salinarum TaxID=2992147 RepID=A0ABT3IY50_9RHOB|nr:DMT family transporter [Defluviimonas salinarum]MCW3780291.1 DMT family transporter [Defluviimonas salinarum]